MKKVSLAGPLCWALLLIALGNLLIAVTCSPVIISHLFSSDGLLGQKAERIFSLLSSAGAINTIVATSAFAGCALLKKIKPNCFASEQTASMALSLTYLCLLAPFAVLSLVLLWG